jgi:hypothetical protein
VADPPHEVDPAVEQHPPVVGRPSLVEEVFTRLEEHLLPRSGEVGDLLVGEPVEEREGPEVVVQHQMVAR